MDTASSAHGSPRRWRRSVTQKTTAVSGGRLSRGVRFAMAACPQRDDSIASTNAFDRFCSFVMTQRRRSAVSARFFIGASRLERMLGTNHFVIRFPVRRHGVVDPWFATSATPQRDSEDRRGVGRSLCVRRRVRHGRLPTAR